MMTNYEWLIKTKRLGKFLIDIRFAKAPIYDDPQNDFERNYGLTFQGVGGWEDIIAEWLQAEHKSNLYVLLEEVCEIMNNPVAISINGKNGKVTLDEVSRVFAEDYKDKMKRIYLLETREINDDVDNA